MAATIWTLLSIFVIAPLGALAFDRPLFGNWIWYIDREKPREYEWASGVTGKIPQPRLFRVSGLEWKESQSMNRLTNEGREINNWSSNEKGTPDENAN
jgi:hypothetical protein